MLAHRISASVGGCWLPTPTAARYGTRNNGQRGDGSTFKTAGAPSLDTMAAKNQWPTPTANAGTGAGHQGRQGGLNLQTAVARVPTPTARDYKDGTAKSCQNVPVNGLLGRAVHQLPTPTAGDAKNARNATSSRQPDSQHHSGTTLCDTVHGTGGKLSPLWVEWLMGWPIGWTDCEPLATDKCRWPQRPLGTT